MDESAFSMEVRPRAAKVGLFRRLLSSVAGAGSTEYVLIIGACSLGGLIGFKNFGKALRSDLGKEAQLILGKETPSVAPPDLIKTPGGLKPFLDGFVPPGGFFPACGVTGCTQCSLPKPSDVASRSSALTLSGTTSSSNGAVDPRSSGCSGQPAPSGPYQEGDACVNQESAKGYNGHALSGTIEIGDETLTLPKIAPNFKELCATSCSSSGEVNDITVEIVDNLKLKQKTAWCPKEKAAEAESSQVSKHGSQPSIHEFFSALEAWCAALQSTPGDDDYAKFLDPDVKRVEQEMTNKLKAMPASIRNSINASLMAKTGSNHTEAKVIEFLEGLAHANGTNLSNENLRLDLEGDWSPCQLCSDRLKQFVNKYGGSVNYCWTKGIYSTGIARENPDLVKGGGQLMGGVIRHQGCVAISQEGVSYSGEELCAKGESGGQASGSTINDSGTSPSPH